MKIYTKVVLDIASGEVEHEESYEYQGPVAECGGGGPSSSQTYDPVYNQGLLAIQQQQQDWANEQMTDVWRAHQKDLDVAQIEADKTLVRPQADLTLEQIGAQRELLPAQTAYSKAELQSNLGMLGIRTDAERAALNDKMAGLAERAPVRSAYYNAALKGVDVADQIGKAKSATASAYADAGKSLTRNAAGLGMSASQFAKQKSNLGMNRALATVGASESARTSAEDKTFNRLQTAMGMGV